MIYADEAAYLAFHEDLSEAPGNIDTLLQVASVLVDHLLVGRRYDVDDEGAPTDETVATTLSDATCLIAREIAPHVTPGATSDWGSVSIGSLALSGKTTTAGTKMVLGLPIPHTAALLLAGVGTRDIQVRW